MILRILPVLTVILALGGCLWKNNPREYKKSCRDYLKAESLGYKVEQRRFEEVRETLEGR